MPIKTITLVSPIITEIENAPIIVVSVCRQRRADAIEIGTFLVDCGCLGVKDAWLEVLHPNQTSRFFADVFDDGHLEKSAAWGRKFVESAVAYAKALGFKPHADYKKAARVFGGIRPEDCDETFTFGRNGKPFYIQGPNESSEKATRICRQLRLRCGQDGFHFLLKIDDLETRINDLLKMAKEGDFATAEAEIYELFDEYPKSSVVIFGLGCLSAIRGADDDALDYFERAIKLDPEMGYAWYNKAISHKKLGDLVPMILAFRQALEVSEEDDEYIEAAHEELRFVSEAIQEDFGIDVDTYVKSWGCFSAGWLAMEKEDWRRGLTGMDAALKLNPHSHQAHSNRGLCLSKMHRLEEAVEAFEKALAIYPDYEIAATNLAIVKKVIAKLQPPPSPETTGDPAK